MFVSDDTFLYNRDSSPEVRDVLFRHISQILSIIVWQTHVWNLNNNLSTPSAYFLVYLTTLAKLQVDLQQMEKCIKDIIWWSVHLAKLSFSSCSNCKLTTSVRVDIIANNSFKIGFHEYGGFSELSSVFMVLVSSAQTNQTNSTDERCIHQCNVASPFCGQMYFECNFWSCWKTK